MNNTIIISQQLMHKFKTVNFTEQAWIDISINNTNDLIDLILSKINSYNNKLKGIMYWVHAGNCEPDGDKWLIS